MSPFCSIVRRVWHEKTWKTYESIGKALLGRENIVVSSRQDYELPDAHVVNSTDSAVAKAKTFTSNEVMIIGGGSIYRDFLPQAQRLYLTFIDADISGDTFFPDYESDCYWQEIDRGEFPKDERNAFDLTFVTLDRIKSTEP